VIWRSTGRSDLGSPTSWRTRSIRRWRYARWSQRGHSRRLKSRLRLRTFGWGRSSTRVIPSVLSGRYSPGPGISLLSRQGTSSYLKRSVWKAQRLETIPSIHATVSRISRRERRDRGGSGEDVGADRRAVSSGGGPSPRPPRSLRSLRGAFAPRAVGMPVEDTQASRQERAAG